MKRSDPRAWGARSPGLWLTARSRSAALVAPDRLHASPRSDAAGPHGRPGRGPAGPRRVWLERPFPVKRRPRARADHMNLGERLLPVAGRPPPRPRFVRRHGLSPHLAPAAGSGEPSPSAHSRRAPRGRSRLQPRRRVPPLTSHEDRDSPTDAHHWPAPLAQKPSPDERCRHASTAHDPAPPACRHPGQPPFPVKRGRPTTSPEQSQCQARTEPPPLRRGAEIGPPLPATMTTAVVPSASTAPPQLRTDHSLARSRRRTGSAASSSAPAP